MVSPMQDSTTFKKKIAELKAERDQLNIVNPPKTPKSGEILPYNEARYLSLTKRIESLEARLEALSKFKKRQLNTAAKREAKLPQFTPPVTKRASKKLKVAHVLIGSLKNYVKANKASKKKSFDPCIEKAEQVIEGLSEVGASNLIAANEKVTTMLPLSITNPVSQAIFPVSFSKDSVQEENSRSVDASKTLTILSDVLITLISLQSSFIEKFNKIHSENTNATQQKDNLDLSHNEQATTVIKMSKNSSSPHNP